jgi:ABC-type microcin C transport system permease subunit YejB
MKKIYVLSVTQIFDFDDSTEHYYFKKFDDLLKRVTKLIGFEKKQAKRFQKCLTKYKEFSGEDVFFHWKKDQLE